jgi:hypothetical protein
MKKKTVSKAATMICFARQKKGYSQLELGRYLSTINDVEAMGWIENI